MTRSHKHSLKSNWLKSSLLVMISLFAFGLILPQIISLHYQTWAGALIQDSIEEGANDYQNYFTCLMPLLTDFFSISADKNTNPVVYLQRASRLAPNQAHTGLLMGRAYFLLGDYEKAVEALAVYHQKRPNNLLGLLDRGFAYFS